MSAFSISFFNRIAERYDETWTNTRNGRMQRNAVWREIDRLIQPGDRILDLGCGTGEDAVHFMQAGATVTAIDGSPGMVEAARRRGVTARSLWIEQIGELTGAFDLVFSNFGALNCVADLAPLREPLRRLIRPGGTLALCVMSRLCLWEAAYYGFRGQFRKAGRRWPGHTSTSSGLRVFYPSARTIKATFFPEFRLIRDVGIGVAVPPSYVQGLAPSIFDSLCAVDDRIAASRIGRAIGDHRFLIFTRVR